MPGVELGWAIACMDRTAITNTADIRAETALTRQKDSICMVARLFVAECTAPNRREPETAVQLYASNGGPEMV